MNKHLNYTELFQTVKDRIKESQVKVMVAANSQLLWLYWQLGTFILQNQHAEGWGAKVIDRLSADLKKEFPALKGFSPRNLKYMRAFAEAYTGNILVGSVSLIARIRKETGATSVMLEELV